MPRVEIGGAPFFLDAAAVSAIRYRAAYGESVVNHLWTCTDYRSTEFYLLRMCHQMIPPVGRPELAELARLARRDGMFLKKASQARDALLATDPKTHWKPEGSGAGFDEYDALALMTAAGLDGRLLYELPILHLTSVARRCFELKNPDQKHYRKMTGMEMATLYPKPQKGG